MTISRKDIGQKCTRGTRGRSHPISNCDMSAWKMRYRHKGMHPARHGPSFQVHRPGIELATPQVPERLLTSKPFCWLLLAADFVLIFPPHITAFQVPFFEPSAAHHITLCMAAY